MEKIVTRSVVWGLKRIKKNGKLLRFVAGIGKGSREQLKQVSDKGVESMVPILAPMVDEKDIVVDLDCRRKATLTLSCCQKEERKKPNKYIRVLKELSPEVKKGMSDFIDEG